MKNEIKVDVSGMALGRAASEVAKLILDKNSPDFAKNVVTKNIIIIENLNRLAVDPRKLSNLTHYTHSGYLGSLKAVSYKTMFETDPQGLFMLVLKRMIPNNRLRAQRLKRVKFVK